MPKVIVCPTCGYSRSWVIRRHHRKCKQCRAEWSPRSYYPIPPFRLSKTDWTSIIETFLRDGTILACKENCRLSRQTASQTIMLIREVMTGDVPQLFRGVCEVDETYVGGAWKNKALHIRKQGSKRGRGTTKQAIFGVIERSHDALSTHSTVRVWLVPNTQNRALVPLIKRTVCKGSTIYSDGRKGYRQLPVYGYLHDWVDHENGEYVRGNVHTQNLDGYWGLLKNHLAAIGGIRKERLSFFIGEHVWRFNHRNQNRDKQVNLIYHLLTAFGGRK